MFESILTTFKLNIVFGGSWGSTENWLEPKTKPPSGNLACPNLWNALYLWLCPICYLLAMFYLITLNISNDDMSNATVKIPSAKGWHCQRSEINYNRYATQNWKHMRYFAVLGAIQIIRDTFLALFRPPPPPPMWHFTFLKAYNNALKCGMNK